MNIFEQASRLKLRFDIQGNVSIEQLWDVKEGALISYEEQLTVIVESYGKSTRRKAGRKTTDQELNELRLAVVTSILDTRIAEREAAAEQLATKAHNQKIMDLIAAKQEEGLKQMSVEELQKMLK